MTTPKYHRIIPIFLIILFIISAFVLGNPTRLSGTQEPDSADATPTTTAYPDEYLENSDITNNIVCGGVVLVLIIIGGTLLVFRQMKQNTD
ncbi:MAG: hypothetical protein JEZ06_06460 [Anaerolineaceae bacterium]|nr:hypothetical protein [Anaerolineaceae bacterium]